MGTITMSDAAKSLGLGRTTLFKILKEIQILDEDNVPYQQFIVNQYFEVKIKEVCAQFSYYNKLQPVTIVTRKGLEFLYKTLISEGYDVNYPFYVES